MTWLGLELSECEVVFIGERRIPNLEEVKIKKRKMGNSQGTVWHEPRATSIESQDS